MKRLAGWLVITVLLSISTICASEPLATAANTGKPPKVNFNFKAIPVKELLPFIAEAMDRNIVMSDKVAGRIALHLKNVTWQEAFNIILEMTGLVSKQVGNVLMIGTALEFAQRQKLLSEAALIKTFKIKLQHADVSQIMLQLKKDNSMLSSAASVSANINDNSLWVKEKMDNIPLLQSYISQLDQSPKQILITAKIITIDDNKSCELGLRFKPVPKDKNTGLHVNLPEEKTNQFSFAIATIAQSQLINLEVSALEALGKSKIIADPRIIALNHQPSVIEAGEEIPYQEKTSSGATSVTFKKAALSLKVTPNLLPDNRILLDLEITQNKVSTLAVNLTPAIQTQELKTQVIVGAEETVILGGIFETTRSEAVEKLPFIGDVPLLGALFKRTSAIQARKELLVMVKPQVLNETLSKEEIQE